MDLKTVICVLLLGECSSICFKNTFNKTKVTFGDNETIISGCLDKSTEALLNAPIKLVICYAPVKVLKYRAVQNLENLESLTFSFNNLSAFHEGALYNLPKLKNVDISFNNLEYLGRNVFYNLPVSTIFMHSNKINFIQEAAFSHLPYLDSVTLSTNLLKAVNSNWFLKSNYITRLDLGSNLVEKLDASSFVNLAHLKVLILSDNKIQTIEPDTFGELEALRDLDLGKNQIKAIKAGTKFPKLERLELQENHLMFLYKATLDNLRNVRKINLFANPLKCSCHFEIDKWARKYQVAVSYCNSNGRCYQRPNAYSTVPVCVKPIDSGSKQCTKNFDQEAFDVYMNAIVQHSGLKNR